MIPRILVPLIFCTLPLASFAQEQSHADAARELLALMHSDQMIEETYSQIVPYMQQMMGRKEVDEERQLIIDRFFNKSVDAMMEELNWEKLEPLMIEIYVGVYSEEELRGLSEFYASPIGQKFVTKQPEMVDASMHLAVQMMENLKPRLEVLREELRDELAILSARKKAEQAAAE